MILPITFESRKTRLDFGTVRRSSEGREGCGFEPVYKNMSFFIKNIHENPPMQYQLQLNDGPFRSQLRFQLKITKGRYCYLGPKVASYSHYSRWYSSHASVGQFVDLGH